MANQELLEKFEELPKELSEDWIEQAIQKLDKSRMTTEQRMHYEMMMAKNASILEIEKLEREQELAEVDKKADKRARVETALNLIKLGLEIDKISEATGLSIDEIKRLRE